MQTCKKLYRVQHRRGSRDKLMLLLQNRLVEADSAEQALRIAMSPTTQNPEITADGDHLASATTSTPPTFYDFWSAALDEGSDDESDLYPYDGKGL